MTGSDAVLGGAVKQTVSGSAAPGHRSITGPGPLVSQGVARVGQWSGQSSGHAEMMQ